VGRRVGRRYPNHPTIPTPRTRYRCGSSASRRTSRSSGAGTTGSSLLAHPRTSATKMSRDEPTKSMSGADVSTVEMLRTGTLPSGSCETRLSRGCGTTARLGPREPCRSPAVCLLSRVYSETVRVSRLRWSSIAEL